MKIPKHIPSPLPAESARPVRPEGRPAATPDASRPAAAPQRTDSVQISDEARARAARLAEQLPAAGNGTDAAKPERSIAEIQQRIRDGIYDSDAVLDAIARRLLTLGELDSKG
jgi:anti-sigma28 factor (negative regulator of flagellin synthesis)